MAKIFSTEKLSLNGDKIRIKTDGDTANTIRITSSDESTVFFRETDVSSLHNQDSANKSTLDSSVASLATLDSENKSTVDSSVTSLSTLDSENKSTIDGHVSSLNTQDSANKSTLDSAIASLHDAQSSNSSGFSEDLNTSVSTLDDEISSLETLITTNDVHVATIDVAQNSSEASVNYSSVGFATAPKVVGTIMSSNSSDPILGIMLKGAPGTTGATFMLSDEASSSNYKIQVLASV